MKKSRLSQDEKKTEETPTTSDKQEENPSSDPDAMQIDSTEKGDAAADEAKTEDTDQPKPEPAISGEGTKKGEESATWYFVTPRVWNGSRLKFVLSTLKTVSDSRK